MITATHNKCDSLSDSQAGDFSMMGKRKLHAETFRGNEGNAAFHRLLGNAALPGENGAVGDEGDKTQPGELFADKILILGKLDHLPDFFCLQIPVEEGLGHSFGKKIKKYLFQLRCIDGPAVGGKAYLKAGDEFFFRDGEGCPL